MPTTEPTVASLPITDPSLPTPNIQWAVQVPYRERIDLAYKAWNDANGALSIRRAGEDYRVAYSTLNGRIKGAKSAIVRQEEQQRLFPEEEAILVKWIIRLQAWGWPARVEQARFMAEDLLRAKGDMQPLGKNWVQKFLSRHKEIKTKYIPPLDKERALAQDPQILKDWFELYGRIKAQYNVRDGDIYNMDEKGFLQGVIAKLRVLLSKYEAKNHMTQCGNREWTSLIECISLTGRVLRPFVIFKAKRQ